MADDRSYVRTDEHGVIRVGRAGVALDGVIAGYEQGFSPETIRSQYPALALEEVYGAITWCLAHPAEVEAYQRRQDQAWADARAKAEANPPPVVRRLREKRGAPLKGA